MTTTEFSNQFDLLFNNITSNQAPGLNEYEKSVFLTKAQDEITKNYFDADSQGNNVKKGFDGSEIRQMDFSDLIETVKPELTTEEGNIDPRALVFKIPKSDRVYIIVNESLHLMDSTGDKPKGMRQVIPLKYTEYTRLMSKPFKEPLKNQAWRLISKGRDEADSADKTSTAGAVSSRVEIVTTSADKKKYGTIQYVLRYVKRPRPIILTDLADTFGEDLTINGENKAMTCELNESTHEAILQRAVELAKIAWAGNPNDVQLEVEAGKRSE